MAEYEVDHHHDQLDTQLSAFHGNAASYIAPSLDSYRLVPKQAAPVKAKYSELDGSGHYTSGSSSPHCSPCLNTSVLSDWQGNLLPGQQLIHLADCYSTELNELAGMDNFQAVQQQQQELPSGSWQWQVNDPAQTVATTGPGTEHTDQQQAQHGCTMFPPTYVSTSGILQDNGAGAGPAAASPQFAAGAEMYPASPSAAVAPDHTAAAGHGLDAADNTGSTANDSAAGGSNKPVLPQVSLRVSCGDLVGTLLVHKAKIVMYEGTKNEKEVSPTEFERLGGRSATKKWKQSIRLINEDGELGRPVGEWYIAQGLEQPKKVRGAEHKDAAGSNATAALPDPASPTADRHVQATASQKQQQQKRPMRAAARNVSAHIAAELAAEAADSELLSSPAAAAAAAPGHQRTSGRRSHTRASKAAAAAALPSSPAIACDDAGSGTSGSLPDATDAAAAAGAAPAAGMLEPWGPSLDAHTALPQQQDQQQQQQQYTHRQGTVASMMSPVAAGAALGASADLSADAAAEAQDAAAVGDYQQPPCAALPAVDSAGTSLLVPVPVAEPLPGDASQAVVEMTAYLEGRRPLPPWRLLPVSQRPLVGHCLVPLRQLFVQIMQAGGYLHIKDDLHLWQGFAHQLGLPAWPTADIPDPLRALQQVYRDYLLRFEGRFTLPDVAAAAATGMHQSPTLSTATQYTGAQQQQQQQQQQMLGSGAGPDYGIAADNMNNSSSNSMQQQQQGNQQRMQLNGRTLSTAAAAEMMLVDTLSGDLLELLTDLIPDNDAAAAGAGATSTAVADMARQPSLPSASAAAAAAGGAVQAEDGNSGSTAAAPSWRQHPEMIVVQRRQRVQQLQQQLQQLQQQQYQQQQGFPPLHPGTAVGAARVKRPPPLIRCGDSDVASLLDQSEVTRLLQDYEQQQQQQIAALRQHQQHGQRLSPHMCTTPTSGSRLAAAIAGAVDRNQSQDLHAIMQQYWQQQEGAQQQQGPQQQQQQAPQQQQQQPELEGRAAEEEMSGMLEALQIVTATGVQQQQHAMPGQDAAAAAAVAGSASSSPGVVTLPSEPISLQHVQHVVGNNGTVDSREAAVAASGAQLLPPRAVLFAQGSVGAHLVNMMPTPGVGNSSMSYAYGASSSNAAPLEQQQQRYQNMVPPGNQAAAGYPPRPSSAAAQGHYSHPQQQQQQQQEDIIVPAFRSSLLRFPTPTTALLGSVLDSPTLHSAGNHAWLDVSGNVLPSFVSADLKAMTVEWLGPEGQAGQSADDLASVMRMW